LEELLNDGWEQVGAHPYYKDSVLLRKEIEVEEEEWEYVANVTLADPRVTQFGYKVGKPRVTWSESVESLIAGGAVGLYKRREP